jgi:hypothetical protein
MMWDSFYKLDKQFQKLLTASGPHSRNKIFQLEELKEPASAKILMFKKR